jgi:mycothiol synthase
VLRPATRDDLPRLREVVARANDAPYDLGAVLEEKCFGRGYFGEPRARVWDDGGALRGVIVTCGRFIRVIAVDRAFRRRGIGSELLASANGNIVFAEPANYLTPGIAEADIGTVRFFRKKGFIATRWTYNMHVPLGALPPASAPRADDASRPRVLQFIEREFGRIWHYEATHARSLVYVEHEGEVAGFAAAEANNRGLGWFGPTGVARALRGRGFGRQLLLASLADLRAMGFARAVIPWTDALDFYRKSCGAEVAGRFVTMQLE